nr:5529_t:CDS:2 [Entrophospora candida]
MVKDPYIDRESGAKKFNEGKVCDYHATVPQGYHAEDCVSAYHAREDVLKAGQKPTHLERINKIRRYANIANFDGINFLHDIDKFEEINLNYATNKSIFPGVKEQATNYSSERREKFCYAQIFQKYVDLFTLDLEAKETSEEKY